MKFGNIIRLFMPLCLLMSLGSSAQSTKEEKKKANYESLKALIESRHYTFTAQSATAMGGRTRNLTSIYTLKINTDSLDADLPYFGRAYTATLGDTDGGIRFRSNSFGYDVEDVKNGGWVILITPKNEEKADKMQLNISSGGYTTLQVTSRNRQMISFYGQVTANKKRK